MLFPLASNAHLSLSSLLIIAIFPVLELQQKPDKIVFAWAINLDFTLFVIIITINIAARYNFTVLFKSCEFEYFLH